MRFLTLSLIHVLNVVEVAVETSRGTGYIWWRKVSCNIGTVQFAVFRNTKGVANGKINIKICIAIALG